MKKIWQKNQSQIDDIVTKFTVGNDLIFDDRLAKYDVVGSIAHAKMLASVGITTQDESDAIVNVLEEVLETINNGTFALDTSAEDIHSQVEAILTEKLGEVGKKIHTGRSRNDQVLLDIKLYLVDEIRNIARKIKTLFEQFIDLAAENKEVLMPGYTHFQVAMPSSFGLWFSAYAEALVDDLEQLFAVKNLINKNPLGSAAGFGSSFPLDREMTTRLLNFGTLNYNSIYAQMTRGKSEKLLAQALAVIAGTLARFSYDICLYLSQNYNFISFPKEFTTGSSIMPHKKNPDIFELVRGHCNRVQSVPNEMMLLTSNLPSGYHRDMQLTKEVLFPAIDTIKDCLDILIYTLPNIEVRKDILNEEKYDYLFSVEKINQLVQQGMSFRDAYVEVGNSIENDEFTFQTDSLEHTHAGSIGNLCLEEISHAFHKTYVKIIA